MLTILMILIGLLLIILFGYRLSRILLPDAETLELVSLGYIVGIGIFTFIWFLLNWAGVPYNLASGFILLFILNIIFWGLEKGFHNPDNRVFAINLKSFGKLNFVEKILLILIIFVSLSAIAQVIYWPIRYWDSLALYDFRAKIFATTGFMQNSIASSYFLGYPLLTSLAHTWIYVLGGSNPSIVYAILYICLIINFFYVFKKMNLGKTTSLLLTTLVAVSPSLYDHTQWAYANLPYSIYIILGSIYLYFGIKNKDFGSYIASALLIGFSTWTRSFEPFWLACILVAVPFSLVIKKWVWPLFYISMIAILIFPWRTFVSSYKTDVVVNPGVVNQVTTTSTAVSQNIQSPLLMTTVTFFWSNVIGVYLIYFILLSVIVLIKLSAKTRNWLFMILTLIYSCVTFAGTMEIILTNSHWRELANSLTRMVIFMPTIIIFLLAELLSEVGKKDTL